MDVYVHDALQQHCRSATEYRDMSLKLKKVAQLAQKLFNLTLLEDTLNARLKMSTSFDAPSGPAGMLTKPAARQMTQ